MVKVFMFDPGNFVPDYNYSLCKSLKENIPNIDITLFAVNKKKWDLDKLNFKINSLFFKLSGKMQIRNRLVRKILKGVEYPFNLIMFFITILKNKPDIIHVQWLPIPILDVILFYILKKMKLNLVYTIHNILPHEKKWYHKYIYRLVYSIFDYLIIHTESNKNEFISIYGSNFYDKLTVIPHGDFGKIYPNNCDEINYYKPGKEKLKFLFFGLIRDYKGLDVLLKALADIKEILINKKVTLRIYGNPLTNFDKYQKIIDENNLHEYIEMRLEFIPSEEIPKIFNSSHVLVLPYKKIYQSGVALLGYTFHLPLIVSDVGGVAEIVEDQKSGFKFPPNDNKKLAEILKEIINNPETINNMKNYISKNISNKYCWDHIAKKTLKLYEKILKNNV